MSYYQSNYPSNYPSYGGFSGGAYPPSSGPPPPPMGYGQSAYNVNQYGYGQQQSPYGGGYSYAAGAVPGFTVPAVQQMQQQPGMMGNQPPPQLNAPSSMQAQNFNAVMLQQQMMMQEQMKQMLQQEMKQGRGRRGGRRRRKGRKGRRRRRNDDDEEEEDEEEEDEEEEEEEDEAEEESAAPAMSEEEMEAQLKERMRQMFIDEVMRRQAVSGTFEITEGTVKPYVKYTDDDPVVAWYLENREVALAGKDWDCEADCEYLNGAMKGLGTNEDAITHVVTTRCNAQRQEMKKMFKTLYGRDLIKEVKGELSGDYKESVMALFVPPAEYDAWAIKEAIYGLGTNEQTLIEILMTRTNSQIQELVKVYGDVASPNRKVPDTQIEKDIENDTSGDFKRLLISACQGNRYEIPRSRLEEAVEEYVVDGKGTGTFQINYDKLCDIEKAKREAQQLFKAGEDRWGTDEETFNRIFSTRDYYTLRAIYNEYVKITQRDILNSVDRETSGDYKRGLVAIVMNIRCRPMYFAERLRDAMKGLGTADRDLIRVIVSRSEIDMVQIKKCFLDLTKQTLWNWLKDDCSGDYRKLLQAIVGKN